MCPPTATASWDDDGESVEAHTSDGDSDESFGQVEGTASDQDIPFDAKTSACFGQPMVCAYRGWNKEFTDGFGLCSPGRWHHKARGRLHDVGAKTLASKIKTLVHAFLQEQLGDVRQAMFKLALGRFESSPWSSGGLERLRRDVAALLAQPDDALVRAQGQPFFLSMLAQGLREFKDPDWEILVQAEDSFSTGVPVGYKHVLSRTPQVFRKRLKFRKLDQTPFEAVMANYSSAELSSDQLAEKFRKDEVAGWTTLGAARQEYGHDRVLVAAMGAIQKPDGSVRPLHDGTHGVNLNNSIRIEDRPEVPGPAEVLELVRMAKESGESVFCICADISHAHRRVLIRASDWGLLGCRAKTGDATLWLNKVGTFGVSSAAYWWTRLFGCVGRLVWHVLSDDPLNPRWSLSMICTWYLGAKTSFGTCGLFSVCTNCWVPLFLILSSKEVSKQST